MQVIEEMSQYEGEIPDYPIQNELTSSIRKAAANIGDKELTHMWSGQSPQELRNNASRQHHHVQYNQSN